VLEARACCAAALLVLLIAPGAAAAAGRPDVAALQVALRGVGLYDGTVDGVAGPGTRAGVSRFQARNGLVADGIAGAATRTALGRRGAPSLGARAMKSGDVGWDVAALQFSLAWHGFPSGSIDGGFGSHTDAAVRRFQAWSGLGADGVAGASTVRALGRPIPRSPIWLIPPLRWRIGDAFGPRGNRFHTGVDYPAPAGTAVAAAGRGTVVSAGWDSSGYGNLVVIEHPRGVRSWYAHLARIAVSRGASVVAGSTVGTVGATGHASGPHLHFVVRVAGAAVDPLTALNR
jgi:peptidoglycan hydrolase-like protein with peptidoglycan-binding domain